MQIIPVNLTEGTNECSGKALFQGSLVSKGRKREEDRERRERRGAAL